MRLIRLSLRETTQLNHIAEVLKMPQREALTHILTKANEVVDRPTTTDSQVKALFTKEVNTQSAIMQHLEENSVAPLGDILSAIAKNKPNA